MPSSDTSDTHSDDASVLNRPAVALLAAGAIGLAVGAVVWQYRRTHPERFSSFDRAIDLARSGAVDTVQKLRRRLKQEGYSPAQIEGRAKKYLSQLIDAANRRV